MWCLQCQLVQDVAEIDVAYENIMAEPTVQLQMLADALGVGAKVTNTTKLCLHQPVSCVSQLDMGN